jgi:uncharacterized membrane-anchored protein
VVNHQPSTINHQLSTINHQPSKMKSNSNESNKSLTPEMEFSKKVTFDDYIKANEQQSTKPLPFWRLIVPLVIQTALIMAIPFQAMFTHFTGKTVILQTVPVNPNNALQGNSVNLDYNIARYNTLKRLPGWQELVRRRSNRNGEYVSLAEGTNFYVTLQEQQFPNSRNPKAWKPVRVSANPPRTLAANQVALKGVYENGTINYGMESYSIPEDQRQQINNNLFQAQQTQQKRQQPILVEVKVDAEGNAVPVSMWVRDRNYRF